ncbi:MAG TPA: phenylacetate--CoA ligase [Kaistiaceae bacterium]|nr:phenylacetate--CoA ligase [Kaistiaceae bacterium]
MFEPAVETMARAELRQLQDVRLKAMVRYAGQRVPHYRAAFAAAGVDPESFGGLADLRRLPFTTKSDLRDNFPYGMFAVPKGELRRLHASSGTTGSPTVVGYTATDIATWSDLMARSMTAAGLEPGQLFHNAHGYGLFTGGLGMHYGAERLGCVVLPISGGSTERQVLLMRDLAADAMCATPSYALNIAEVATRMGIDLAALPIRRGMFGGEPWSEAMRASIEAAFGITACDVYGLSEILGPGVGCECVEARSGPHLWEDHFLIEVIDPKTLEAAAPGEVGELVVTTLTKQALPMIRYRTRDMTRIIEEPCVCGRTHRRIMRVRGRDDDMLIVRGMNVYPSQIEAALIGLPGLAPHYQIVLARDGALDALTVEVEALPDALAEGDAARQKERAVSHHLKSMTGITCKVALKAPGEVPRSVGKAVRVRDLRER